MGNFKREAESQNNAVKTNYIKAKIDNMQQNSKCWLSGDRDEIINYIIRECSQLVQKVFKIRYNWMRKVIHWELCKKLKFDHTIKWYLHKTESVLENETHKILWYFEIQMDQLTPARRPDLVTINKKKENQPHSGLCCQQTTEWKSKKMKKETST